MQGGGQALPSNTRNYFEPRFGYDFGSVRTHSDEHSAKLNRQIGSQAFTFGNDIYFGAGKYSPQNRAGQYLMAHELAHVIQQSNTVRSKPIVLNPTSNQIQKSPGYIANFINDYAQHVPGFTLFTVLIGKNPITGEVVPRTAKNLIGGILALIPGGKALFNNLNESGAVDEALVWLEKEISKLNISLSVLKGLVSQAWDELSLLSSTETKINIIKKVFSPLYNRVKTFAGAVFTKVKEFVFKGALKLVKAPVERIMSILNKGKAVISTIISDPIRFVKNLVNALRQGINQFFENIFKHLKAGVMGWLFGTMAKAGVTMPTTFSIKSIFVLVAQVLGLTKARIRAKIVKRLGPQGEKIVSKVEETAGFVKDLFTRGPIALWEMVKSSLANLKQIVLDAIISWVKKTIMVEAIKKLLAFFNPASAVIEAITAIYNTIMFFVDRIKQIADFVESVFDSIAKIAGGDLKNAADAVENAMAKAIPVIVSFLARLIGLGGISQKIKDTIKKIREPIDLAVNKVIMFVVKKGRAIISKAAALAGKTKEKVVGYFKKRWNSFGAAITNRLATIGKSLPESEKQRQTRAVAAVDASLGSLAGGTTTVDAVNERLAPLKKQYQFTTLRALDDAGRIIVEFGFSETSESDIGLTTGEISYKSFETGKGKKYDAGSKNKQKIDQWLNANNYKTKSIKGKTYIRLEGARFTPGFLKISGGYIKQGLDLNAYGDFLGKKIKDSSDLPEGYSEKTVDNVTFISKKAHEDVRKLPNLAYDEKKKLVEGKAGPVTRKLRPLKIITNDQVSYNWRVALGGMFKGKEKDVIKDKYKAQGKTHNQWESYYVSNPDLKKRPKRIVANLGYVINARADSDILSSLSVPELKTDDDKGHLVARRFEGVDKHENLVPMNSTFNRSGGYYQWEEKAARRYKNKDAKPGDYMHVDIDIKYKDKDTRRPNDFKTKLTEKSDP